jgi:CheY-like chemotaxis protein/KaiC/GvpD/RAD55 family RecA-like ATPase
MGNHKVLVADDTKNIVQLMKYNLEKEGFDVLEVNDGEAAVATAISERPSLIILDVSMPKKNGFEVCRELRENRDTCMIPIIIVSSRSSEYDKLSGFELGADEYLTKPFRIDELLERANALINGKSRNVPIEKISIDPQKNTSVSFGDKHFDQLFSSKLLSGVNILVIGPYGSGKSTLARKFLNEGFKNGEAGLYVSVEDPQEMISEKLNLALDTKGLLNILSILGIAGIRPDDFDDVFREMIQSGADIGQSISAKKGGRRVIDSLSGLLAGYGEQKVFHFLSQIVHTATAFGGVTTLFTLDEEAVTPQQVATIKSFMDGVVELVVEKTGVYARVVSMKWIDVDRSKIKIWSKI